MSKGTQADKHAGPNVMIDVVLLTVLDGSLHVVLGRRDNPKEPFHGREALIGGFIHVDEDADAEEAAARILRTKAGLESVYIEQLMTFSGRNRDPRGWSVSIAYMALVPYAEFGQATREGVSLRPTDKVSGLPFDHDEILGTALRRLRGKGAYSTLPTRLLGDTFTLAAMNRVYEQVMGNPIDQSSFRRKVSELGLIEETGDMSNDTKRPAKLFRLRQGATTFDRKL